MLRYGLVDDFHRVTPIPLLSHRKVEAVLETYFATITSSSKYGVYVHHSSLELCGGAHHVGIGTYAFDISGIASSVIHRDLSHAC